MKLPYSKKSHFFVPLRQALDSGSDLAKPLRVDLGPRGYERDVRVTIRRSDQNYFATDWKGSEPTRFSARIRAAATVLQQAGYFGTFRIVHAAGVLTIEKR